MAEQYQSFNSQGPNIDVNLYPNAASAGNAAGNATPSTLGAIFQGAQQGIQTGLQVASTVQGIQAQAAQTTAQNATNEVNADPKVQQARKDQIVNDAALTQAKADDLNSKSDDLTKAAENKAKLAEATQKYDDITAKNSFSDIVGNNTSSVDDVLAALTDPKTQRAMHNDNDFALQGIAQARGKGVDPALLDNMGKVFAASELDKQTQQLAKKEYEGLQTQAAEQKKDFNKAVALYKVDPKIDKLMSEGTTVNGENIPFNATKLSFVPANSLEVDPKTKQPVVNPDNTNVITSKKPSADTRYYAMYNGQVAATYDEATGKELAKQLPAYQLGYRASITQPSTVANTPQPSSGGRGGLADVASAQADSKIDKLSADTVPAKASTPVISAAVLEGKTPAEQQAIKDRYNAKVLQTQGIPREHREIVARINNDPALANTSPVVKAFASVESGGKQDAVSPTKVKGIMQITGATYDGLSKRYPNIITPELKGTEQGQILAGKFYIIELLNQFHSLPLAAAAYNAGPGVIESARHDSPDKADWNVIKPYVAKYVSPEKYQEVKNYPEQVLQFYKYYNG